MKKRAVRIRENSWLARIAAGRMGYGHIAMVVGHTVHLHNTTRAQFLARPSWVLHELKHVEQYERHGVLGFLWRYFRDWQKNGYYENVFEKEARAAEEEVALLERYDLV